jgi:hypothetical protein
MLTIGKREGSFEGMIANRQLRVRLIGPRTRGFSPDASADRTISYSGEAVSLRL